MSNRVRSRSIRNSIMAMAISVCLIVAKANTVVINPTSDGSLYVCDGCNVVSDGGYVLASGYIQGDVKFASAPIKGTVKQAILSLNPYGLPLYGNMVDVYGYGTKIGPLDITDADAGVYIGTLTLPPNLGFGQDAFFDVTNFVAATQSPFLAFNLRSTGTDVFSSLEYNYGHPSQLRVTTVPEPTPDIFLAAGLLVFPLAARRRVAKRRQVSKKITL